MLRSLITSSLLLLAVVLGACATDGEAAETSESEAGAAPVTQNVVQPTVSPRPVGSPLSEEDWALLQDPAFKERLRTSFLSETEIEPKATNEEIEVLSQASTLLNGDDAVAAIALLEENNSPSGSGIIDGYLGGLYASVGEVDKSADAYATATLKHPKFLRAWRQLGEARFRQGDKEAAIEAFTETIELGGGDGLTYGMLGRCYLDLQNYLAAESAFRVAMIHMPERNDFKLGLAKAFFDQERFPEAVALFDNLIEQEPDNGNYWLTQGKAYIRMGELMKAAERYEYAHGLGAATASDLVTLGNLYAKESLWDPAVSAFLRSIELNQNSSPSRLVDAAKFMASKGAHRSARNLIDGIATAYDGRLDDAQQADMHRLKARVALLEGQPEQQIAALEEVVRLDPLDGDALIKIARFHAAKEPKDIERAVVYFEQAANIEDWEADARLYWGELMVKERNLPRAIELLKESLELRYNERVKAFLDKVEEAARR